MASLVIYFDNISCLRVHVVCCLWGYFLSDLWFGTGLLWLGLLDGWSWRELYRNFDLGVSTYTPENKVVVQGDILTTWYAYCQIVMVRVQMLPRFFHFELRLFERTMNLEIRQRNDPDHSRPRILVQTDAIDAFSLNVDPAVQFDVKTCKFTLGVFSYILSTTGHMNGNGDALRCVLVVKIVTGCWSGSFVPHIAEVAFKITDLTVCLDNSWIAWPAVDLQVLADKVNSFVLVYRKQFLLLVLQEHLESDTNVSIWLLDIKHMVSLGKFGPMHFGNAYRSLCLHAIGVSHSGSSNLPGKWLTASMIHLDDRVVTWRPWSTRMLWLTISQIILVINQLELDFATYM